MRNVWKGLVIGGLTGAAAGLFMDALNRGARLVGVAGRRAADLVPEAVDRVKAEASGGMARVHDAEVGDRVRGQAKEIAHRVADSDQADQAREALEHATKKGKQLAHAIGDAVPFASLTER